MKETESRRSSPVVASAVPRGGVIAMASILIGMALLSVYSNTQKVRRDRIEKVTITPAATRSPSPTAAPP